MRAAKNASKWQLRRAQRRLFILPYFVSATRSRIFRCKDGSLSVFELAAARTCRFCQNCTPRGPRCPGLRSNPQGLGWTLGASARLVRQAEVRRHRTNARSAPHPIIQRHQQTYLCRLLITITATTVPTNAMNPANCPVPSKKENQLSGSESSSGW